MRPEEIILHIGPPKCASTSIQHALRTRKDELATHGVRAITRHSDAIADLFGGHYLNDIVAARRGAWKGLLQEITRSGSARVIYSNELLGFADEAVIQRITESIGAERVSVVLAARPISRILPSYWQERVKSGSSQSLSEWVDKMVAQGTSGHELAGNDRFWRAERHDHLAARWARAIGPNRVNLIVLNEERPGDTLVALSQVLGTPSAVFDGVADQSNRSLSMLEAVALQQLNATLLKQRGGSSNARIISTAAANRLLASEVAGRLQISLPQSAVSAVSAMQSEITAGLQESGIRIIGDVKLLNAQIQVPVDASEQSVSVSTAARVAADAVLGALSATGVVQSDDTQSSNGFTKRRTLLTLRTMIRALSSGIAYRIALRIRRLFHRP